MILSKRFIPMLLAGLVAPGLLGADGQMFPTIEIGASAPDFRLPGVDGRKHALKDFRKSPILVVVFTCNHCPTAQYYEDRLKKIVEDYGGRGVAVVAIMPNEPQSVRLDELGYTDLGDSFKEMKIRARQRKFNFPYLYDGEKEEVSRAYGPVATPHVFVFDKERKLRYRGRIDDSERPEYVKVSDLRNALDALLAGHEAPVKETKSFGCSIKWAGKAEAVKQFMDRLASELVGIEPINAEGLKALRKVDSGKVRLINFWATWCGPCMTEFPDLVEINRMYRHRAFEFIAVSANYPDEQKQALNFLKKQQASNKNFIFGDRDKYKLMEAFDKGWQGALPYTVLLSSDGEVLYREQGPIDPLELKRAIVKSLKEDRFTNETQK